MQHPWVSRVSDPVRKVGTQFLGQSTADDDHVQVQQVDRRADRDAHLVGIVDQTDLDARAADIDPRYQQLARVFLRLRYELSLTRKQLMALGGAPKNVSASSCLVRVRPAVESDEEGIA